MARTGHIYLVISEGQNLGKIGYCSELPEHRLSSMQTGNPSPLYVESYILGTRRQEGIIHAEMAEYRQAGEWFRNIPLLRIVFDVLYSAAMSDDDELEEMTDSELRRAIKEGLEEALYEEA